MIFSDIFRILHKCLGEGCDEVTFFHNFMSMITKLKVSEWRHKEPGQKLTDATIRTYIKRGIPKNLARKILYSFTPEYLIQRINEASTASWFTLLGEMQKYDKRANNQNLTSIVLHCLAECLQKSAGFIPLTEIQKQIKEKESIGFKNKYGTYLLHECMGTCPVDSCGRELFVHDKGETIAVYEIAKISQKKKDCIDNLIAMCPHCYATYQLDNSKTAENNLKSKKKLLASHLETKQALDNLDLERGVSGLFVGLQSLKPRDFASNSASPKLDPVTINEKISINDYFALNQTVYNHVNFYFNKIESILIDLDKKQIISYEALQNQISNLYIKIKEKQKNKEKVYEEIAEFIHRKTLADLIYCHIVVAYFVQKCEVFDATS